MLLYFLILKIKVNIQYPVFSHGRLYYGQSEQSLLFNHRYLKKEEKHNLRFLTRLIWVDFPHLFYVSVSSLFLTVSVHICTKRSPYLVAKWIQLDILVLFHKDKGPNQVVMLEELLVHFCHVPDFRCNLSLATKAPLYFNKSMFDTIQ